MSNSESTEKQAAGSESGVRETYTIMVIRNRSYADAVGDDVLEQDDVLDVTAEARVAAQLMRAAADVVAAGGKAAPSKAAAFVKGLTESLEKERARAKTEGRPDPLAKLMQDLAAAFQGGAPARSKAPRTDSTAR